MFKKQYIYILIIGLLATPSTAFSEGNSGIVSVKVTYIANEGFIISSGSKQILMDALFEGYHSGYHVEPSNATINKMKECQAPFDSVDLITISHEHLDHVSSEIVGNHLECNSQGVVICNSVVADMMKSYINYEQIKSRINSIMPDINSSKNDTINGIPIKVLRFRHAMPQFINMVNLGFVIHVGGIKIFHSGDSWGEYIEELEAFQLNNENIDIAFLHHSFFKIPDAIPDLRTGVQKVKQYINPKYIILMHVNPNDNNYAYALRDSIENDFQGVFFFDNSMDSVIFENLTSIKDNKPHSPQQFMLNQNFPNPFNSSTTIQYFVTKYTQVKLCIYNIEGQKIKTLVNQFQTPGKYSIIWDRKNFNEENVNSGMYFYEIVTLDKSEMKKMLIF